MTNLLPSDNATRITLVITHERANKYKYHNGIPQLLIHVQLFPPCHGHHCLPEQIKVPRHNKPTLLSYQSVRVHNRRSCRQWLQGRNQSFMFNTSVLKESQIFVARCTKCTENRHLMSHQSLRPNAQMYRALSHAFHGLYNSHAKLSSVCHPQLLKC